MQQDRFHRGNDKIDQNRSRGRDQQVREHNDSYKRERSRDRDHDGDHRRRNIEPFDRSDAYRDGSRFDARQQTMFYPGRLPIVAGGPPPPPPRMAVGPPGVLGYPPPQQPMMQLAMPLVYPPISSINSIPFVPPQMGGVPGQLPFVPPQMGGGPGQVPQYMGLIHAMPPQQYAAPPGAYPNRSNGNNNRPMRGNQDSYGAPVYQPPPAPPPRQPPYAVRPSSHQSPPPQRGPVPGSYPGAPYNPSAPVQRGWQQQQQQPLTVDILGLADKAAYAVQALANQNHLGMPPANMMRPPPGAYPGAPPNAYGQPPMNMPHPPGAMPDSSLKHRRTTATMQELPVMVQYAVQV